MLLNSFNFPFKSYVMPQPDLEQVPSFYHNYIKLVPHQNLTEAFENYTSSMIPLLKNLTPDKWNYRYAEGKWTIKEMVQHMIDTDRIFGYRALAIARGEKASLPGFDENAYAALSAANDREPQNLIREMQTIQTATALLFDSFTETQLAAIGTANGKQISVNAIGYITVGHTLHHKKILTERYL